MEITDLYFHHWLMKEGLESWPFPILAKASDTAHEQRHTPRRVVTVYLFKSPVFHLLWCSTEQKASPKKRPITASKERFVCVRISHSLTKHFAKYLTRYFPNELSFLPLCSPPELALERAPPPPFRGKWRGPSRSCICFVLILLMRETALISGASFDPQQTKTKKHLSYFLLRLLALASLLRGSVMSEDEVSEVVQGSRLQIWKLYLRVQLLLDLSYLFISYSLRYTWTHLNTYTKTH